MKENIKKILRPIIGWLYRPIRDYIIDCNHYHKMTKTVALLERDCIASKGVKKVFYLGITEQPNLGDMAQHYCISKWLEENYNERCILKYESSVITYEKSTFIDVMKRYFTNEDIIVFQSGYCTQDLGGDHPLLHQKVINAFPQAKILMMPQTIFFQKEENKLLCAQNHNKASNMLFLARDFVSYDMAKEMFPDIRVMAFPDIVTTLIGTFRFENERKGICICRRNDGEKYYSESEIYSLAYRLNVHELVTIKDTQGKVSYKTIRKNLKHYIEEEIASYSHYKVTITDRYHGTIFSLAAGTPVIILKTTDHKVTTGADWFKGIYDDYIYVAKDLEDVYNKCLQMLNVNYTYRLPPYMKQHYYDKLKTIFES